MALTLNATPGSPTANSYELSTEADLYFEGRLALDPPWEDVDSKDPLLVMATRQLDAMFRGTKVLIVPNDCSCAHYTIRRVWNGTPATKSQRLSWPRLGLFDQNGDPLDFAISSITVASPTVITTVLPHGRVSGETVLIIGSDSTPTVNGARVVTVLSETTFSIPVAVTVVGTTGTMTLIPQDLKDSVSEMAGQLSLGDRTLDNDVSAQGITSVRAGSVAVTFRDGYIDPKVLPDAVVNLLPPSWYTEETYEPAQQAIFEVLR